MSHEEGTKEVEAGKTDERSHQLEQYDVEAAIGIVRQLGEGLIEATMHSKRHSKHHFRREWMEQLIEQEDSKTLRLTG